MYEALNIRFSSDKGLNANTNFGITLYVVEHF